MIMIYLGKDKLVFDTKDDFLAFLKKTNEKKGEENNDRKNKKDF